MSDKIFGLIPELSKQFVIDMFCIGQMSLNREWEGDIDLRKKVLKNLDPYLRKIIIGEGINYFKERAKKTLSYVNIKDYDLILYDDNRLHPRLQMPEIYLQAKRHKIPVVGNSHGNQDAAKKNYSALGRSYDYAFLLGEPERKRYSKWFHKSKLLIGGIPSNDVLKNYEHNPKHLLVVPNFLDNRKAPFKVKFGQKWANIAIELSKHYGLPIVVKQKTRTDDRDYIKNVNYIKSIFKNYNRLTIVNDTDDLNRLISDSAMVLSALSNLAFIPIALGIPTVLIKESGQLGNLEGYPYQCGLNYESVKTMFKKFNKKRARMHIKQVIAGGANFNSTEIYINELKRVIR